MKSFSIIVFAVAAGTGVMSAAVKSAAASNPIVRRATGADIPFGPAIIGSPAWEVFKKTEVYITNRTDDTFSARTETVNTLSARTEPEPDPNRPPIIPPYIFVLQCTLAGFLGDCLVFGAPPGNCVSYFDFEGPNSTDLSDRFNNQATSLSTNTGGRCQFYKFRGCDNKGDDRGLTVNYNYNLDVPAPDDPRTVEYYQEITSWRC